MDRGGGPYISGSILGGSDFIVTVPLQCSVHVVLHTSLENLASSMHSARLRPNYNYEACIRLCSGIYIYILYIHILSAQHVLGPHKFYAAAVNMPRCIPVQVQ